ncbi:hypothetical protein [Flavobacterium sp. CS20]|uniref:hypothetical protein n=1 Tax=Flavobacterium sp. CS20 TaxID=2775246 RepID=UPI001B39EE33|nr:hypothetical protein [Flavobacterium sp. CS20]QTY27314.1 hypothetical protein IGB25_01655 [Flavobacterium sp. CS20]
MINFFYLLITFSLSNECVLNFNSVGINDYELGMSISEIKKCNKNIREVGVSKRDSEIIIYSFSEISNILDEEKKVEYFFAIKDNSLVAYVFNIYSGKKISYYKRLIEEVKASNDFIVGNGISFLDNSGNCEKFMRIKSNKEQIIIFGGISSIGSYW